MQISMNINYHGRNLIILVRETSEILVALKKVKKKRKERKGKEEEKERETSKNLVSSINHVVKKHQSPVPGNRFEVIRGNTEKITPRTR